MSNTTSPTNTVQITVTTPIDSMGPDADRAWLDRYAEILEELVAEEYPDANFEHRYAPAVRTSVDASDCDDGATVEETVKAIAEQAYARLCRE